MVVCVIESLADELEASKSGCELRLRPSFRVPEVRVQRYIKYVVSVYFELP